MTRAPSSFPAGSARKMRFEQVFALVSTRVRGVAEKRGFAVTRLLTDWADIVGPNLAARTRPVKITHGKEMGGTLTLLTTGANAPLIEMQAPLIREKVNACYGYNAIARVRVTQTAPVGFAEGQAVFTPAPRSGRSAPHPAPDAAADRMAKEAAKDMTRGISDPDLRAALETLALNRLAASSGKARAVKG